MSFNVFPTNQSTESHHTEDSECGALLGAFLAFLACKWLNSHFPRDFRRMGTLPAWRVLGLAVELPSHCWNASAHPYHVLSKLSTIHKGNQATGIPASSLYHWGFQIHPLKLILLQIHPYVLLFLHALHQNILMFSTTDVSATSRATQNQLLYNCILPARRCWMKMPSTMQTAWHILFLNSL